MEHDIPQGLALIKKQWQVAVKKNRFLTNIGAYLSGNILQKAVAFLLLPVWAQFLSPADYGIIGTLTAYSGLLTTVLVMGLHGAAVRQFYDYVESPDKQKSYISSVFLFLALTTTAAITILLVTGPLLWEQFTTNQIPFNPYIRIMLLSVFVDVMYTIPMALYQAQQKARDFVSIQFGKFLLGVLLNALLVIKLQWGALGMLLGPFIADSMVLVIVIIRFNYSWFTRRLKREYILAGLAFGLPLVPHGIAAWILQAADRVILEHYVPLAEVGFYSLGYTLGMAMLFLVTSINQAWSPYYYRLMQSNPDPDHQIIKVVSIYVSIVGGICLFGVLFASEIMRVLLPPRFYPTLPYIAPVLFGYLFLGYYYFAGMPLFYFKKTRVLPVLTGAAALINIALNLYFVPKYGAISSAWATMLTYSIQFLLTYWIGRRCHVTAYPFVRYGLLTGMIFLAAFISPPVPTPGPWFLAVKTIYWLIYLLIAYLLLITPYYNWRDKLFKYS